jgi:hypothetical protein
MAATATVMAAIVMEAEVFLVTAASMVTRGLRASDCSTCPNR